ncbi:hypothetical protein [Streptomyces sp. NPDC052107]|uniref:hypothetical protein n=1 Tax=Streptomyces sp. NPDC052107 TaxID=3155632 RepID=UPI0034243E2C
MPETAALLFADGGLRVWKGRNQVADVEGHGTGVREGRGQGKPKLLDGCAGGQAVAYAVVHESADDFHSA